jgi:hypothetical protein
MIAVGVAGAPTKAEAYAIYTRVYTPFVVVRPPVDYSTSPGNNAARLSGVPSRRLTVQR